MRALVSTRSYYFVASVIHKTISTAISRYPEHSMALYQGTIGLFRMPTRFLRHRVFHL